MAPETPIGTRIRRARERLLWTQRQLADAVQVDEKTVRNWEAGRYPRNRIGALEQVLGVRLSGPDEPEPEIPESLRRQVAALTPRQRKWMKDWLAEELREENGDDRPQAAQA